MHPQEYIEVVLKVLVKKGPLGIHFLKRETSTLKNHHMG